MNPILEKIALPLGLVLIVGLIIGGYFLSVKTTNRNTDNATDQIVVDVVGAVNQPDIYTFKQGSIIEDAIKIAGGFNSQADLDLIYKTINRAALLQNHGKVYIPAIKAAENNKQPNNNEQSQSNLININTANLALLDTLPGVGPITAERIIEYRETKGQFNRLEDLMKIEGVSNSKYNKLKNLITI